MSDHSDLATRYSRTSTQLRFYLKRFCKAICGDWTGVSIFFGALVFFSIYWRLGIFITDTYTVANTLVGVADGHLYIDRIVFGPSHGQHPGTKFSDGRVYGRNYGLVYLSVPLLWILQGLSAILDIRVLLIGAWSLTLLGFFISLGEVIERGRLMARLGLIGASGLFLLNLSIATELIDRLLPLMALQIVTMVAAALTGVLLYRLVTDIEGRRLGAAAGAGVVLATPLGFWAVIPKRHALTAVLLTGIVYAFFRSRRASSPTEAFRFRALSYALVAGLTLVFAGEALLAFLALLTVDLATYERRNELQEHLKVASVFLLALIPFFLTNMALSGNPLVPVDFLSGYHGQVDIQKPGPTDTITETPSADTGDKTPTTPAPEDTQTEPGGESQTSSIGLKEVLLGILGSISTILDQLNLRISRGLTAVSDTRRVYHTFIRSGYVPEVASRDTGQAINLSLLESAPLFVGLLGIPLSLGNYVRNRLDWQMPHIPKPTPVQSTDLLVLLIVSLFILLYLPALPLHATVTVRYLVPIMPLMLYGVARVRPIQHALDYWPTLSWTYGISVLIGGQLLVVFFVTGSYSLGEVMQFHALLNLSLGLLLMFWLFASFASSRQYERVGAIILGLTAAATTVFIVLSGIEYFAYSGEFSLPMSRVISEWIHW